MSFASAKEELLAAGLDDMLDLSLIDSVVANRMGIDYLDETRQMPPSLEIIRDFLAEGWAIAGDVVKGPEGLLEVRDWGLPPEKAVEKIRKEWLEMDRPLFAGDVVWLELTEKGRAFARRLEGARDELLVKGLDDRLDLSLIGVVVAKHMGFDHLDKERAAPRSREIIYEFLAEGWAIAGDLVKGPEGLLEVRDWGLPPGNAGERAEKEWLNLDRPIRAGDVGWLELTDKGRAHARSLEG
jgi:hypothetical protein